MRLQVAFTYPAPPDDVFAMLCDVEFRRRVCAATGALEQRATVERNGDGAIVTTVRVMPPQVPDIVRTFVGDRIEIVQRERWGRADASGRRGAELALDITGTPATMRGTVTLEPLDDGTRETIAGDVKVAVPFFGGRIEPEIVRAIELAIAREGEVGRAWLSGDRHDEAGTSWTS